MEIVTCLDTKKTNHFKVQLPQFTRHSEELIYIPVLKKRQQTYYTLSLLSGKIKQKTPKCLIYIVPTGLHHSGGCFYILPIFSP